MALASPKPGRPRGKPFTKGCPGGPGNPLAAQVSRMRAAVVRAITPEKIEKLVDRLYAIALNDDQSFASVAAAKELLMRGVGKPQTVAEMAEELEKEGPPKDGVQAEATWLKQMLGFGADVALIDRQLPVVIARWKRGLYAEWGMPPPPAAKQVESKPVGNGNGNGNGQH